MRRQRVATGAGPRLAATASLLLASAKIGDHIADGDGLAARRGVAGLAGRAADRYRAKAGSIGTSIGLDVDRIADSIDRQKSVEDACGLGSSLEAVTAPTAEATGELFAHAAVVAERPGNVEPFRTAGAAFEPWRTCSTRPRTTRTTSGAAPGTRCARPARPSRRRTGGPTAWSTT
ncbi:hypothetical protein GCM10029992_31010 [Glycomyces albus]